MDKFVHNTAQAIVFAAPDQPLELQSFALPVLKSGEALIRVSCCTLCGSDIHTFMGHRATPSPTILGHEILGNIAALPDGETVLDTEGKSLSVGDRVTWSVAASCNDCFFCDHELPQKCEHLFKYGHERITPTHPFSGGLAEYCHLAAGTAIFRVPDFLPDVVAAPANCATATVAAAMRVASVKAGETVLIQGAGMLGLTASAMAAALGARNVIVCDVDASRLEIAKKFGATHTVDVKNGQHDVAAVVKDITADRGVDAAIELSGAIAAMEAAAPLLRTGGRYVLVGAVFPGPSLSLSPEMMIRRLLSIYGVHNYTPADLAEAIRFLEANYRRFPFADLVSKTYSLANTSEAFAYAIAERPLRVAVQMFD